ncbi:DUF3370 domain-containing protein [Aerosakkonema funiforme]|uniref:DUF3370 domain-containing protein n=1 Tax=Aerosakkonema funiforme FACHB-1375 TaxID=2949571 RepID=A0A926ZGH9_9CYAN|nr:DUF3370 domain-containing protein [Aerosakkonema funiforme]MBD2182015.1 DUF3370 domain-containing protein [Aerosakkonema funiforme FACHB-1375]
MFFFLPSLPVAQIPEPAIVDRRFVTQTSEIRPLPGQLDRVLVFNSNSPEVVQTEGILLSTFPTDGKAFPQAHLNKPLVGRFDLFSHHIARSSADRRSMYQGLLVYNPNSEPVTIEVLQAVSYANNPDAPFIDLPTIVEDPIGSVFSGPGSRVMGEILRGKNQPNFPSKLIIPPQQTQMLFSLPILRSSGRTVFMRLQSSAPVYMANLAMYAIPNPIEISLEDINVFDTENYLFPPPTYREPTLEEWQNLLISGRLAEPRDRPPIDPEKQDSEDLEKVFGRVAGVSIGSEWNTRITDRQGEKNLTIPTPGNAFSYPISTVNYITLGTRQVQSAQMAVGYPDTALAAHGNYAVRYHLTLPLFNNSNTAKTVILSMQTPFKQENSRDRLFFVEPPQGQVFFRGTVRVNYIDDAGINQDKFYHLVQRQGQLGEPLVTLNIPPNQVRQVTVDFLYPPDATPPQVVTVKTLP